MFGDLWILAAETGGGSMGEWVSRGVHVFAAMLAVGALAFQAFALRPALGAEEAPELAESIRKRWAPFTHIAITLLIVTGLYQLMVAGIPKGKETSSYHMYFGIKFLLAMVVFFFVSALGGRSAAFQKLRENGATWGRLTLLIAIVIVALSMMLRSIPHPAG